MTFAELKTELIARGATDDGGTRLGRWINLGYRKIANAYDWPFTEVTATGTALAGTVVVADVRKVQFVGDISSSGQAPGRQLSKITPAELSEELFIDNLATTGTPDFWYMDPATSTIKTYPLGGTVYVRYYKRLDELTGVQAPVFDEEYHPLIVDRAMIEAYKDTDELDTAAKALAQVEFDIGRMALDYQLVAREHSYIQAGEPFDG